MRKGLLESSAEDLNERVKSLPPPIQKAYKASKKTSRIGLFITSVTIISTVFIGLNLSEDDLIDEEMRRLTDKAKDQFDEDQVTLDNNELRLYLQNSLLFDYDKSELNEESKTKLKSIVSNINDNMIVEIIGHTDNIGGDCYNYRLSRSRAETVYKFIRSIVNPSKSLHYGLGEDYPISTNNTEFGRSLNRRVELRVKKDSNKATSFPDGLAKRVAFIIQNSPIIIIITFLGALLSLFSQLYRMAVHLRLWWMKKGTP